MLTMPEREEAAAAIVYELMLRLLADYRRYGRSPAPGLYWRRSRWPIWWSGLKP